MESHSGGIQQPEPTHRGCPSCLSLASFRSPFPVPMLPESPFLPRDRAHLDPTARGTAVAHLGVLAGNGWGLWPI